MLLILSGKNENRLGEVHEAESLLPADGVTRRPRRVGLMDRPGQPRLFFAVILIFVGSALLLSTVVLPWYSSSLAAGSNVANQTLCPATVVLWGTQGGNSYIALAFYSAVELRNTGVLYLVVAGLVVAGGLLGLRTAYLMRRGVDRTPRLLAEAGLRWGGIGRTQPTFVLILLGITIVLALSGPVVVAFAQPGVVCSDSIFAPSTTFVLEHPNNTTLGSPRCEWEVAMPLGTSYSFEGSNSPGPQSSFFGTNNETGQTGQVLSWGPSAGWYLALAASALLVIGAAEFGRATRRPELSREKPQTDPGALDPPRAG
jgi:hypothetical protein